MSFAGELYEFFNEARPRTKSAGAEDRPSIGPGSGRQQRDPDIEKLKKAAPSRVSVNPEGIKSEYKPGSVHEIRFNNITKGVAQQVYTIYRTLSESDYKILKTQASNKVVTFVTPSSEQEHDEDIYYVTIPQVKYGVRKGADYTYFIYASKDKIAKLSQEQKDKIKLRLVPIKDIADGLSARPLTFNVLSGFLSDKQKGRLKREKSATKPKQTVTSSDDADVLDIDLNLLADMGDEEFDDTDITATDKPEEEPEQVKAAKRKAAEFMLDDKVDRIFSQLIKNYDLSSTASATEKERKEAKDKTSEFVKRLIDALFDMTDNQLERSAVIDYNIATKLQKKQGLYKIIKLAYDNMESINEGAMNEATEIKDDQIYDASVRYDGGKSRDVKLKGKALKKLIDKKEFVYNSEIPFETVVDDPKRGMVPLKGTVKVTPPAGRSLKLVGRRAPDGTPISYDPAAKAPEKKEPAGRTLRTTISGQGSRSVKVPDNLGVKRVDVQAPKGSQLAYKFYVIDNKKKEMVFGTNDWKEAKDKAAELGPDFEAVQKIALTAKGIEIKESLSKEDKDKLMTMRVSFTIQSDLDPDKQYNISDNVKSIKDEKTKFIIDLAQAGTLTFDKMGTGIFKYSKDNKEYQALNVPSDLMSIVKKSFEPAKEKKEPEATLEAYIRKRVQQAIKEAEISQYWGYQGDEVKKKRLEEYMKKYRWGFQTDDDPYQRSIGSEIHGVVTKLVHELGDEGLSIFNSYAPKGFEAANVDDLDYMSDTPLGSQLTQPYNPDSLTARGGRVAEEDTKVTTGAQRAIDKINATYKDVESLAKGYNNKDSIIMGSPSGKSTVQKALAKVYGDNPAKAGPELKKAFMSISDEELKKSK